MKTQFTQIYDQTFRQNFLWVRARTSAEFLDILETKVANIREITDEADREADDHGLKKLMIHHVERRDVDVELDNAHDVARSLRQEFADPMVAAVAPRVRGAGGPTRRWTSLSTRSRGGGGCRQ